MTDERLIERTGGIVQGMSGSPILQNGKIVGAVTHVMVNEPTKGYGILIENMLAEAGQTEKALKMKKTFHMERYQILESLINNNCGLV